MPSTRVARALLRTLAVAVIGAGLHLESAHAGWSGRSYDAQNGGNVGPMPGLVATNEDAVDLKELFFVTTEGIVNATPAVTDDGLIVIGDWAGYVYVIDATNGRRLVALDTGTGRDIDPANTSTLGDYVGVQSTAVFGSVTMPDGTERERFFVGANTKTHGFYCFELDAIRAKRAELAEATSDGAEFLCADTDGEGLPVWPVSLDAGGSSRDAFNGSPQFSRDQPIDVDGDGTIAEGEVADVIFTPTTGVDCANGEMWAIDAVTGRKYWSYDPVVGGNGQGGVIWTTPAMKADRSLVYVTTGNCVTKPQAGEQAESLVALDAGTGAVVWHHQRRLVDTADLDIGNGAVVVDVPEPNGCNVVVSPDKDGCMYGFSQTADIPGVGELGFDPLRVGQQRMLWRTCFVPGSLNGGFNAANATTFGRVVAMQASGTTTGRFGGDNATTFAVDACTGQNEWVSTSPANSRADGAAAGRFGFFPSVTRSTATTGRPFVNTQELTVVDLVPYWDSVYPDTLATVALSDVPTLGGGGVSIAGDRVYVPTVSGVSVVGRVPGSQASPPANRDVGPPGVVFAGPYPHPVAGVALEPVPLDPDHPERLYPLMLEKEIAGQAECYGEIPACRR